MALWELEQFQAPEFLGFIRTIPVPDEFIGVSVMPPNPVSQLDYEYQIELYGIRKAVMAAVMGFDSEAPIAGRRMPGVPNTVRGELPPIKRKAKVSEKELIKFQQPRPGTTEQLDVISYVYDLTTELVDSVQARIEWLRMQALSMPNVTINADGVNVTVNFGIPAGNQYDAVATSGMSGHYWNDTVNSNPIADLDFVCNAFELRYGFRPASAIVDVSTKHTLLLNVPIRDMVRGPGGPTVRLQETELEAIFGLYALPELLPYRATFNQENADGTYTLVKPFNRNVAVLLPPPEYEVGSVLMGPTAEANQLPGIAYSEYAPGIVGRVYATDEPPGEWIKVAAVAFPVLPGAQFVVQITCRNDL